MKIEIKSRWTGSVIFEGDFSCIAEALTSAIKKRADLSGADLSSANLRSADLSSADLSSANLRSADLSGANLRSADLRSADLSGANLRSADLRSADLRGANLSGADLSGADLSGADLSGADLRSADLSGVKSFQLASVYLKQFERDDKGIIVFRSQMGERTKPVDWKFEPGAFLTENPNPDRSNDCACGVNFATLEWVKQNYSDTIWKCRINWEDLADVVVPFNTPGKARCARLELLEVVL